MDPDLTMDFFAFSLGPDGFPPRDRDDLDRLLDLWLNHVEESEPWNRFEAGQVAEHVLATIQFRRTTL